MDENDEYKVSKQLSLTDVLIEELKHNRPKSEDPKRNLDDVFKKLHAANLSALCFSGGGIRSATFGLGIVQALAKNGLLKKFDYLSTVSGGGYLGSWLSAWVCREHAKRPDQTDNDRDFGIGQVEKKLRSLTRSNPDDPNPEPTQLQHLREYSNYMSPKAGLLSADTWTLIAIYVRNLFLNLTIFIPLIAAILMLPRFLFLVTMQRAVGPWEQLITLIVAIVSGSWAIAFVMTRLPSKTSDESVKDEATTRRPFTAFMNTDAGVLTLGVIPLVLTAYLGSCIWAWSRLPSGSALGSFNFFSLTFWGLIDPTLAYYVVVPLVAYVLGLIFFFALKFKTAPPDVPAAVAAFVSSVIGGLLLWVVSQRLFEPTWNWVVVMLGDERGPRIGWLIYQSLAVPVFLLVVLGTATAFVGFTSRTATDEDREWLARYGGWMLIVSGAWILTHLLVLFGPSALQWTLRFNWRDLFTSGIPAILSTIVAVVSGVVSLVGGFSDKSQVREEPIKTKTSVFLAYAPRLAAVIFLGFIFVGIAYLTTSVLGYFIVNSFDAYHSLVLAVSPFTILALVFLALTVVGLVMACFVNVNKFSLHGAYRDRLVRAYLGASNKDRKQNTFTGFDDNDNLELHELDKQRPLHVINGTVNLVGGDNLAWQNRKAASFTMSPLHCGSWAVKGYRMSREYCRSSTTQKALRLGTAMAISGAAANPNMGYYSSSVVTFLMSLFNIRLGWWLGNTGEPGSRKDWFGRGKRFFYEKVGPSIAVLPLINETLGRTDEKKRFLMVTDGGHFENLAVYEMVRRRCRFILLSDGAADESFKFGEIANAIQKCKVDLGVDIQLLGTMSITGRTTAADIPNKARFALAEIIYPEKDENDNNLKGWLLYTRPTYYGTEPRDIINYAESNVKFPHQSTGDQMYDEKQFEAYRGLGYLTMMEVFKTFSATSKGDPHEEVDDNLENLFSSEHEMRKTIFDYFGFSNYSSFKPRNKESELDPNAFLQQSFQSMARKLRRSSR